MADQKPDIHAIFNEAVEREFTEERSRYLDDACQGNPQVRGRVEALLRAHSNAGKFLGGQSPVATPIIEHPPVEQPGTMIGSYKLIEEIGEGGMGSVFMALQKEPVRRKVALKVIKPGMDSKQVVSRFEAERQALAMMDHPNIAKVHDGGTTESGRPYFVMELVNGIPITDYSDRYRLTTNDRLELFGDVCRAVQHAHQKGIIHRDLKPSNILVTLLDGRAIPKVIDFGIAKATRGHLTEESLVTHFAQMIGSPLYMSPEQAQLSAEDVDTRSDVYSLGVLLYELLTRTTPFDRERMNEVSFDEFRRMIREEEPPRPSNRLSTLDAALDTVTDKHHTDFRKLSQQISGELDWIVMKALEKDRARRYETANDLAKDVQRYLNDDAVEACPPSTAYRLGKFARRHKARLVIIAAVTALLVVATVGGSAIAWNRHQQKTELARAVNKELDGVRQSLQTGDLAAAERKLTAARTRLNAARHDVERLQTDVARLSKEVSAKTRAQKRFQEFQQIRERVFSRMYDLHKEEMKQAAKDCRTALNLFNIFGSEDWKRQPAYRNLHQQLQQTLEEDVVELMFVMSRLEVWTVTPDAWTILDEEDRRVVVDAAAHRRAIDVLQRIETVSRPTAGVYAFLSQCWRELGRTDEVQKTDAVGEKLQPSTALDYYILGELLAKRGSRGRALERYGQALGRDPTHYLSLLAMGDTLEKLGQLQTAEMALTGAIGANPRPTFPYIKRALIRLRLDKRDLALSDFAEAARRDPTLAKDYDARGHWNLENGEPDQAISDWTAAVGLDPENAAAYFHRGRLYAEHQGDFEKAIADFCRTIEFNPQQAEAYYSRAIAYDHQGKFDRAAADFGEAITRGLKRPAVYTRRGTARALSGSVQLALEDYQEAIRLDPHYAPAFLQRGIVFCDCLGEFERAIADFDAAIRLDPQEPLAPYNRAVASAAKCELEGAAIGWSEAIRLDPRFAEAYFERGILYCNGLDEFGKAVADFNEVLRLAPQLLVAYYNRGIACYQTGDLDQALASWTRAIQLGFTRVEVYCSRGLLYAQRGELQKAVADFDEAIRIDPEYTPAYNHRASARAALGQAQEAADDRAEAARLRENQQKSTRNKEAAGEDSLATTALTGQASPERLVCASEEMTSCILRRTGSRLESRTMFFLPLLKKLSRPGAVRTGQAHSRHFPHPLRPRRLSHEPLEARQLLSTVSGTVFEDLDADGVRDTSEQRIEGWTVVLDRTDPPELLLTFLNPTPGENDLFGFSVAAAGDNVLVGAFGDDTGATDAGAAYLFDGSTGDLLQTFLNPTPEEDDHFGLSVGALGDKVLVGANGDNTKAERAGAAYLFDGATGELLQTFLDPTPHPTAGARFGWSFAEVGDNVLISAPWNIRETIPTEGGAGAAYLFHGSTGELLQTFLNPTPEVLDAFGYLVATVGSNILISAPWDDTGATDAGAAYLFDGTTGELLRTFLNPTPENGDEFGSSVAAVGSNVLIGAWLDDTGATDAGAVYLFDGTTGELLRTFVNSRPEYDDRIGNSVAAVGNNVLIGAHGDNINATSDGAAYLFDGATGELLQSFLNPTPQNWDMLGWSVAAVGDNILTGVAWDNAGANDAGAAHLFEGVSSAATDANGNYTFTDLEDGTYRIWQVSPEGYFQTTPGGGGSDTVIIAGGVPVAGPDFGMAPTTTNSYDNNVPTDLKDAKNAVRPGVTRSTLTIADSHRIVDLNVKLSITHPRPEDLDVFLIAPDGTRVELFTDVTGAGSTITLDDEAPRSIVDAPYQFADAYHPEGSLAAVDGTSTEGTWTLEVADDTKGQVGTLNSWSLSIECVPFPPPPPGPPSIDSLLDGPDPVRQGQSMTLTANGVVDDGDVTSVAFYRDDGDGVLGAGDTLLATDTDGTDGWAGTIVIPSDFATGVYVYFARATDSDGLLSNVVSATNEVKKARGGGKPKNVSGGASLAADRLFASGGLTIDSADRLVDDRFYPTTPIHLCTVNEPRAPIGGPVLPSKARDSGSIGSATVMLRDATRSSIDLIWEEITANAFDEQLADDLALAMI